MNNKSKNYNSRMNSFNKDMEKKYAYDYEILSCIYHKNHYNHEVWHWHNVPENILYNSGWLKNYSDLRKKRLDDKKNNKINTIREYGLDAISKEIINENEIYHAIQSKYWRCNNLSAENLGTFFSVLYNRFRVKNNMSKGYLYHSCDLTKDLEYDIKNSQFIENIKLDFNVKSYINKSNLDKYNEESCELYDFQKEALNILDKKWKKCGLLLLPCGTGKTLVTGNHIKNCLYNNVIVISPLKIHAKQNLDRLSKFIPNYKSILFNTDDNGTTDVSILKNIEYNNLISTTYKSGEIILKELFLNNYDFTNSLIIIDEAHNIFSDEELLNLVEKLPQVLLLTATYPNNTEDFLDYNLLYEYNMSNAIKNKHICDYRLILPYLDNELNNNIENDINNIKSKIYFVINGMLQYGSRKCIVYLSTDKECDEFNILFKNIINEYHGLPSEEYKITCDTPYNLRDDIIKKFENNNLERPDIFKIISSIRILDEGIDIVKCDSVFITKIGNDSSDIRFIQRLCRANRLDKENPNKVANCFIWANEYSNIVNSLNYLKYTDNNNFIKKINLISDDYDKNDNIIFQEKIVLEKEKLNNYVNTKCIDTDSLWNERYEELYNYINLHNSLPNKDDKKLYNWSSKQRTFYNKNILEKWKIEKLNDINIWSWNFNEDNWIENYNRLYEYVNLYNKLPHNRIKNDDSISLGAWCNSQRLMYRQNKLNDYKIIKLEEIDIWFWNHNKEEIWMNKYEQVKDCISKSNKLPDSQSSLYHWIIIQKNNKNLSKKRTELLNKLNVFNMLFCDIEWNNRYDELLKYVKDYNKIPSQVDKINKGLGGWCSSQILHKRKGTLSEIKIKKLEEIKIWKWDPLNETWEENYNKLIDYIDIYDKIPSQVDKIDKKLGQWASDQRKYNKKNKLSEERYNKLNSIKKWFW